VKCERDVRGEVEAGAVRVCVCVCVMTSHLLFVCVQRCGAHALEASGVRGVALELTADNRLCLEAKGKERTVVACAPQEHSKLDFCGRLTT
jgi:hypothetical protein